MVTVFSSLVKRTEIYSWKAPRITRMITVTKMLNTMVKREYFFA